MSWNLLASVESFMCQKAGGCNGLSPSVKTCCFSSETPGKLLDLMKVSLDLRNALVVLHAVYCSLDRCH